MKNYLKYGKMLKFLTFLISSGVLANSCVLVFATQNKESGEVVSNAQKKEEPDVFKIEENFIKNNAEIYKNFNIKDFEIPGFKLEVYSKLGILILVYEDEITKAKFIFIPIDGLEEKQVANFKNVINFSGSFKDNKGITHILEHCLAREAYLKLKDEKDLFNMNSAFTDGKGLNFYYKNSPKTNLVLNSILTAIKENAVLKNKPKLFEAEKKRALQEQMVRYNSQYIMETLERLKNDFYWEAGFPDEVKTVKLEDVMKRYEEQIHPSNMLSVNYVNLESNKIKEILNIFRESYLKFYNYKKIDAPIKEVKKIPEYRKINKYFDCNMFDFAYNDALIKKLEEVKLSKFVCHVDLDVKEKEKNSSLIKNLRKVLVTPDVVEKLGINSFIESLGYLKIEFLGGLDSFKLYGNSPELFEEAKLKENCVKILNYVKEKWKSILENSNEKVKIMYSHVLEGFYSEIPERILSANNNYLNKEESLKKYLKNNKNLTQKLEKINEISNADELFKILINESIFYFTVFVNCYDENKKMDFKYKGQTIPLPIKVEGKDSKLIETFVARDFIIKNFSKMFVKEDAISYFPLRNLCLENGFLCETIVFDEFKDYFMNYINKNYENFIENFKIKEKEFEELKAETKKNTVLDIEDLKNLEKDVSEILNAVNIYLDGKEVENKTEGFKIVEGMKRKELAEKARMLNVSSFSGAIMFKNFDEYLKNLKQIREFEEKYPSDGLKGEIKIDKIYVKDFKENFLNPNIELINKIKNFTKELLNKIDYVKVEEVEKIIKSSELVEEETYEEDLKKLSKIPQNLKQQFLDYNYFS